MPKIIFVEDDLKLAEVVTAGLTAQDYVVEHIIDGADAFYRLQNYHFDIAILDWDVPGKSGVEVCRDYRNSGGHIPILMLTGKSSIGDKEQAFGTGADDYLTKPFSFKELAMRVRALLRRPAAVQGSVITAGGISMDLEKKNVTIGGEQLALKPAEFSLLELFVKSPGRVFTSAELLTKLYHSESEATDEAVRQRVFRLRKLLGDHNCVKSVPGGGYRLEL